MAKAPRFTQVDPRHPVQAALLPLLAALLALAVLAVGLFYFTRPAVIADGAITGIIVFPVHSVAKANLGTPGTLGEAEVQDEMYVLCHVRVTNRLQKLPLFIQNETATLTLADGQELHNTAASPSSIPRFFQAYPAAHTVADIPLPDDTRLDPGKSAQGLILVHFPVSQDAWDGRRSAVLAVGFYNQVPVTLVIRAAR